jgi:hypothetical protein
MFYNRDKEIKNILNYFNSLKNRYEHRNLQNNYNKYTKNINLKDKYIYFPLHFQPEMTTSPQGGIFSDQHLAISIISKSIPVDWKIYVKEHPSQFRSGSFFTYTYLGRDDKFYSKLNSIPKVKLIPIESNHFNILDNAKAIATITGTVGWEAVVRGKLVLIFGDAWYQQAPNVYRVKDTTEVKCALSKLSKDFNFDKAHLVNYVNTLLSLTENIFFDDLEAKWANEEFEIELNTKKLYNIIEKKIKSFEEL